MPAPESTPPPSSGELVVESDELDIEDPASDERKDWEPKALQRRSLLSLALLFAAIAVIIGALYGVSLLNNGLCNAHPKDHYLWTYAPTAFFTLMAAIWSQVEFRAKQMQPWRSMKEGSTDASESVMLDYISPWNVIVLFKALKRRQVAVALAICSSLLLQLLIVLSTGLFTLSTLPTTHAEVPLAITDTFISDGSSFNPDDVDARPALIEMGISQKGLHSPPGTTRFEAFQQFSQPYETEQNLISVEATVEVLSSNMNCEMAEVYIGRKHDSYIIPQPSCVTYQSLTPVRTASFTPIDSAIEGITSRAPQKPTQTLNRRWPTQLSTPNSCQVLQDSTPSLNRRWPTQSWTLDSSRVPQTSTSTLDRGWPTQSWTPNSVLYIKGVNSNACGNVTLQTELGYYNGAGLDIVKCPNIDPQSKDKALLFWFGISALKQDGDTPPVYGNSTDFSYGRGTLLDGDSGLAVLCRPSYCLRKRTVISKGSSVVQVLVNADGHCSEIPGFDVWHLFSALENSISKAIVVLGGIAPDADLIASWLNAGISMNRDSETFIPVFQPAWSSFAAQVFSLYFRRSEHSSVKGMVVSQSDRLIIRSVSFWVIESCLILLVGLSAIMVKRDSKSLVPRDPSSIIGLAAVLSNSHQLMQDLVGTGAATVDQLAGILSPRLCETSRPPSRFAVKLKWKSNNTDYSGMWREILHSVKLQWYRPFSTRKTYKFGVPAILIATMVTLEYLLFRSQQRNGICDVKGSGNYEHFAWTVLPAAFMSSVALIIEMQLSSAKEFVPYSTIAVEPKSAAASLSRRPFSSFAVFSRRIEAFFAISVISVLVGSFLTIVVSGLFTAVPASNRSAVTSLQEDKFPLPRIGGGYLEADLILNANLSFPQFTYDDLAISKFSNVTAKKGLLEMYLPSLRGKINCTIVPQEYISNISASSSAMMPLTSASALTTERVLRLEFEDKYPCIGGEGGDFLLYESGTPTNGSKKHTLDVSVPEHGYFGAMLQLYAHINPTNYNPFGTNTRCPNLIGTFGRITEQEVEDLSLFTCSPFAEYVMTTVTFELPAMHIHSPPVVNESTADPFRYRFGGTVDNPLEPLLKQSFTTTPSNTDLFDPFMTTLVYGSRGIPAKELSGRANQGRLLNAMNDQYGISLAQYMNGFREPTVGTNHRILNGTLIEPGRHRLIQSEISTHVLVGLIGILLIATVLTALTMNSQKVLPKCPCSIGAVASLLVDSDFLDMMPQGSERMSDQELLKLFENKTFSMGWWTGKEGEVGKRRYGIDFGTAHDSRKSVVSPQSSLVRNSLV